LVADAAGISASGTHVDSSRVYVPEAGRSLTGELTSQWQVSVSVTVQSGQAVFTVDGVGGQRTTVFPPPNDAYTLIQDGPAAFHLALWDFVGHQIVWESVDTPAEGDTFAIALPTQSQRYGFMGFSRGTWTDAVPFQLGPEGAFQLGPEGAEEPEDCEPNFGVAGSYELPGEGVELVNAGPYPKKYLVQMVWSGGGYTQDPGDEWVMSKTTEVWLEPYTSRTARSFRAGAEPDTMSIGYFDQDGNFQEAWSSTGSQGTWEEDSGAQCHDLGPGGSNLPQQSDPVITAPVKNPPEDYEGPEWSDDRIPTAEDFGGVSDAVSAADANQATRDAATQQMLADINNNITTQGDRNVNGQTQQLQQRSDQHADDLAESNETQALLEEIRDNTAPDEEDEEDRSVWEMLKDFLTGGGASADETSSFWGRAKEEALEKAQAAGESVETSIAPVRSDADRIQGVPEQTFSFRGNDWVFEIGPVVLDLRPEAISFGTASWIRAIIKLCLCYWIVKHLHDKVHQLMFGVISTPAAKGNVDAVNTVPLAGTARALLNAFVVLAIVVASVFTLWALNDTVFAVLDISFDLGDPMATVPAALQSPFAWLDSWIPVGYSVSVWICKYAFDAAGGYVQAAAMATAKAVSL